MKKSGTLLLLLGGAAAAGAILLANKKPDLVTGKSGHPWRVTVLSRSGDTKVFEVFAPAGSFGPHGEVSVVRYSQTGSNINSRPVVSTGSGLPPQMLQTAVEDFGLQIPGQVIPLS